MVFLGVALIGVAGLFLLIDWGDMSKKMPTQAPPRSVGLIPLTVGMSLLLLALLRRL